MKWILVLLLSCAFGQSLVAEEEKNPSVIVVFGATGDLAARKLFPAMYDLAHEGHLSENVAIVGLGRKEYDDEAFRDYVHQAIGSDSDDAGFWPGFAEKLFYSEMEFNEDSGYEELQKILSKIDADFGTQGNRLYYLSTAPSQFPLIIEKLSEHGLIYEAGMEKWSRVVIEKPFGRDLQSAIDLQNTISTYLDESQIYRIDHYLGKEGVQNLAAFRFDSALFEPVWNSSHIDNVQITIGEDIGIGSRANFWEETGYLRDIFQNHLMQLLAVIAMEPPAHPNPDAIHEEKIKALQAIRPFPSKEIDRHVVRGQYAPGSIQGSSVLGYKQEKDVPNTSTAETFMAAQLFIDNKRWKGVPFYIRGGKRLPTRTAEIAVKFKSGNILFIRIQPDAGVFFKAKGGDKLVSFGRPVKSSLQEYGKLIYDGIQGDDSLFVHPEEQLAAWRLLTPVIDYWKTQDRIALYQAGTWGPQAADKLVEENGRQWLLLE